MKKNIHCAVAAAVAMAFAMPTNVNAEIPLAYYTPLQGLCGEELKTAIHEIVGDPGLKMLNYGSGNMYTWWGFYVTDRNEDDNSVVDRYSNQTFYFGERGKSVTGMNIEHSFPKSWWGGTTNNAYKDLFNLMPCEQKINSTKSNYPMGVVTKPTPSGNNGCTRVGAGEWGGNWWEPADKWKGDFARGYMYMATAYQNLEFTNAEALKILVNGDYPTLQPKVSALYIDWAKADDVTEMEAVRNDRVQSIQGNRNPFVDFPNLMEYIWGDSVSTPLDLRFTRKSAATTGVITGQVGELETLYENSLMGDRGGFAETVVNAPGAGKTVWKNTAQYGWTGSAFYSSANHAAVSDLVSGELDLTGFATATLTFDHAVNFASAPSECLGVYVRDETGRDTKLNVPVWPKGSSWTFTTSGQIGLDAYAGHKVRVVFRYTSTASEAATWEVKNVKVTGRKVVTGIGNVPVDIDPDSNKNFPVEYYTLDGRRIDPATYRGIVIRRQGSAVSKELLK